MILFRKTIRSIWRGKRSYIACISLILLGIAAYTGFTDACQALLGGLDSMYATQSFGDAFAEVQGIPASAVQTLAQINGIEAVSARTALSVRLAGDRTLQVISLDSGEPQLSSPILEQGELPGAGEIALNSSYLESNGLSLGDSMTLTASGQRLRLTISGSVIAPDFVAVTGGTGGYAYVTPRTAQALAGSGDSANEIIFLLKEGVSFREVELDLTDALERYGLVSLYERADHSLHYDTYTSIMSLGDTAGMIAFVFLTVAVLVLTIILRRAVEQERMQIGTLKAFGFSGRQILMVYLGYGVTVSLVGALLGILAGKGICAWAVGLYRTVFCLPQVQMPLNLPLMLTALTVALLAGLLGAALGTRSVLKLSPAEAMRPPAPKAMRPSRRVRRQLLPAALSMVLRNIFRGGFRSIFVAGGMALSFAILSFMSSYGTIMDEVLMTQFTRVQLYDLRLDLAVPAAYGGALAEAARLDGTSAAEALLEVPATACHAHLNEPAQLIGLPRDGQLWRLYDSRREQYVSLPESGAVISYSLADKLGAAVGDTLLLTTSYTKDEKLPVLIAEVLGENLGDNLYLPLNDLCRLLGTGAAVNGILLQTSDIDGVKTHFSEATEAVTVTDQSQQSQLMRAALDQSLGVNVGLFAIIGFGVAFALIAATASISLSERAREYATLRVLGQGPGEIGRSLMLEYLCLTAVGFLPGIPLAIGLKQLMMGSMGETALSISPTVAPGHFLVSGGCCLLIAVLANLASIRHIARLSMTDVLKERE